MLITLRGQSFTSNNIWTKCNFLLFLFIIFSIIWIVSFGKNMDIACLSNMLSILIWKKILFWVSPITSRNCVIVRYIFIWIWSLKIASAVPLTVFWRLINLQAAKQRKKSTQNCQARGLEMAALQRIRIARGDIIDWLSFDFETECSNKPVVRRIPVGYHENEVTQPLQISEKYWIRGTYVTLKGRWYFSYNWFQLS